jgi:hypothetical protein
MKIFSLIALIALGVLSGLAAPARALSLSDQEAKRMLASMQTAEAAALEARYFVDHAAGVHDKMVRVSDGFYAARATAGSAREQALRTSFHGDGFYHTLYHVAETLADYAFLETEVKHAQSQAALDLSSKPEPTARGLLNKRSTDGEASPNRIDPVALVETGAKWGWAKKAAKRAKKAARAAEQRTKAAARAVEQRAKAAARAAEQAARAAAEAAAAAARAIANALSQATSALADLRDDAKKGVDEIKERLQKVGDFAGELTSEIKSAAENVKNKIITVAGSMKRAAGHIKTPFDQVLSHLGNNLPTALQDKSDCHNLKIKPTGVRITNENFRKCFNFLPGKPCPSITVPIPTVSFEEKQICNPSKAVKTVAENAFSSVSDVLQNSAKAAINEIVNSDDGGRFLETAEGQGNTAQLLAQINEQQGAGAAKVTRSHLRSSAMSLSTCAVGQADFAVWFRYGISVGIGQGNFGATLNANLGLALGCDGAGTAFMFPTIDIGLDLSAGVGVTGGLGHSLAIDVFANYDGLGRHGSNSLFKGGTGHAIDTPSTKSVWGNKLGWGLGAGINIGNFGIGFSFTMPALEIGTSSVLGLEFPSSANVRRPRLAGIGISGDATAIWNLLAGNPKVIGDAVKESVDKPELSISLGIGYVGIIGGEKANWFKAFGELESSAPAKGASCNNMLNDVPPARIFDCGDNVFMALPKSILTEWPFN